MTTEQNSISTLIRVLLFGAFVAGGAACIYFIMQGKLTERESAMLGLLLAILSILASWIITDMYSSSQYKSAIKEVKEEHRNNLRTYALKASEKVNNLSNELQKLSIYLEEELNFTDYRSSDEELLAKEERIESAIHLVRTLKSVNDTALSDWEGVIGEELDQHREELEEREEQLKEYIAQINAIIEDQRQGIAGTHIDTKSVRQEIERLRRELRIAMFQLSGTTIPKRIRTKEPKQDVSAPCPTCKAQVAYKQRASVRSFKQVRCIECGSKLISTYAEPSGFSLKLRQEETATPHCPNCETENKVRLDNFPGSNVLVSCSSCKSLFRVLRTLSGTEVAEAKTPEPAEAATAVTATPGVTEAVLKRVHDALPPQPWPTGTHLVVAQQLNIPSSLVRRATNELIRRGLVNLQLNGVLYQKVASGADSVQSKSG